MLILHEHAFFEIAKSCLVDLLPSDNNTWHDVMDIARDVTLAYPDYLKEFEVYTDVSKTHFGAVITQNNRPAAIISQKLIEAWQKYSMTEIELFATVETLKEFKDILWRPKITVYT